MNPYSQKNTASRQELGALVNRLSEAQLQQPLEAGWTVAGVLAHLAFWDRRALTLLQQWQQQGIGPSAVDVDVINEATRFLCISLAPHQAVQLVLSSARAVDEAIERLAAGFLAAVEKDGPTVHLDRSAHRHDHLRQIKEALHLD